MAEVHPSWSSPSPSSLGSPTAPDELINSLRDHSLFQRSNNAMFLEDIARNMHIRTYGPRDVIIVEGEQAKAMFLLLRGSVDVCSADFERLYATLDQGTCFGEIGILYSIPRTATVVAKSKCTVAVLTAEKVASILPDYPEVEQILRNEAQERLAMLNKCPNEPTTRRSSMIASFDATSARNHLQKVALFKECPEEFLHQISLKLEPKSYPPNARIIRKDDIGDEMFFIIDGTVQILSSNNDVVARLGSGDYFGEISILLDVPRTADVRSVTHVDMYVLSKADFIQVCASYPQLDRRFKDLANQTHRNIQQQLEEITHGMASIDKAAVCSTTCDQDPTLPARDDIMKLRETGGRRRRPSIAVWADPSLLALSQQKQTQLSPPESPSPPQQRKLSSSSPFISSSIPPSALPSKSRLASMLLEERNLALRLMHHLEFGSVLQLAATSHALRSQLFSPALLTRVDLESVHKRVTDDVLTALSGTIGPHVQSLSLAHCFHITDTGLITLLEQCTQLEELNLNSCWLITDTSLLALPASVKRLDLSNCRKITDRGLYHVVGGLTHLTLSYCKNVTNRSMALMGEKSNARLEYLNLQRCTTISDAGFETWQQQQMAALRSIDLSDCSFLTDKAIRRLVHAAPRLENVCLSFCCALSESAIEAIASLPNLSKLDLSFCGAAVSDASISILLAARSNTLQVLNLRGCIRLSAMGLMSGLEHARVLRHLNVSQCPGISKQAHSMLLTHGLFTLV
ncbi:hypothetical protein O0I10_008605 [Lichtheimia ornata]|uniref:Cyclic nucleotide-binding domain-containing protein n=1 Tax=Lichtheimia ornata TaxID=688661 RepID=A0AAD7UYV4_9FUNG|nr:uncharacterized protein O0I10_008605 [Lichtheimia ornata]KAJ8655720.1 hypothetical protein O0I10_008605 [Lichtheimia ornata]